MSAAAELGLEWTRPAGLLALALPVALLLASRLLARPAELATGTLDLWKRVRAARASAAPRSRRRIPPAVWLLAAGLALGALALAGPRRPMDETVKLRVLVDASPSMDLPLGAGTRRDRAAAMARAWIDRNVPAGSRIEWIDRREPLGPEDDRPDALWVTDAAPVPHPERAGLVASGGAAVPGPIAVDGSTRYDWDGERIVAVPDAAPKRIVAITGEPPKPVAEILSAWAGARGAVVGASSDRFASLRFESPVSGTRREVDVGRDGWKAKATVVDVSLEDSSTWLEDAEHRALVACSPGRIRSAVTSMEDPVGDPAAFAVSWAKLFDDCVLAPPGVIELAERRAAGNEAVVDRDPLAVDRRPLGWETWIALLAVGCVALAAGLARSGRME